jgi:hypothetical protein
LLGVKAMIVTLLILLSRSLSNLNPPRDRRAGPGQHSEPSVPSARSRTARLEVAYEEASVGRLDAATAEIEQALEATDRSWGAWSPEPVRILAAWAAILRNSGPRALEEYSTVELEMERRLRLLLINCVSTRAFFGPSRTFRI